MPIDSDIRAKVRELAPCGDVKTILRLLALLLAIATGGFASCPALAGSCPDYSKPAANASDPIKIYYYTANADASACTASTIRASAIFLAYINDADSTVTFSSGPGPSAVASAVTTGAGCTSIPGTPTSGNVAAYKYGTNATCAVEIHLVSGFIFRFTVTFTGSYATRLSSVSVSNAPTTTTLTSDLAQAVQGQRVTFTATVATEAGSGTPPGSVNFTTNGSAPTNVPLSNGMATYVTSAAGPALNVTAAYLSSAYFLSSTKSKQINVDRAATRTTLTTSQSVPAPGQPITLTIAVGAVAPGAGAPTGNVSILEGATIFTNVGLTNGVASATITPATEGPHFYQAKFSGNSDYNASTSDQVNVVVHTPCADAFASAAALTGAGGSAFGSTAGFTGESGEPLHTPGAAPLNSAWCKWTAPASGPVTIDTTGSLFDTALAVYTGGAVNALTPVVSSDNINAGNIQSRVSFAATAGTVYVIAIDGTGAATGNYVLNWSQADPAPAATYASILPTARSVATGATATAFATLINAGATTATGCSLAPPPGFPGTFSYQITNASNLPTGAANTPQNIAAGVAQSFVFAVTPLVDLNGEDMAVVFDCTNTPATATVSGLNTLLLTSSATPGPDMISIGATPSNDGILNLPGAAGASAFAASAVDIGPAGTVVATIDDNGRGLPLTAALCQSNPATAACVNPATPGGSATLSVNTNDVVTFTVFVTGAGNVPFDPANNRLFLRLKTTDGVTRGATSVAVRTQ